MTTKRWIADGKQRGLGGYVHCLHLHQPGPADRWGRWGLDHLGAGPTDVLQDHLRQNTRFITMTL